MTGNFEQKGYLWNTKLIIRLGANLILSILRGDNTFVLTAGLPGSSEGTSRVACPVAELVAPAQLVEISVE